MQSEKQRKAMYAAANGNSNIGIPEKVAEKFISHDDDVCKAAFTLYITPDDKMLFLKRTDGTWGLPGGGTEYGESPVQTAERESMEEIGALPYGELFEKHNHDGYVTFKKRILHRFVPRLSDEHTDYVWCTKDDLPEPLIVDSIRKIVGDQHNCDEVDGVTARMSFDSSIIAMDKATVRSIDQDGRLHVEMANISKSMVCPYYGYEIPDGQRLGLQPDKVYMLLRDRDELKKSVPTWNGIPVLNTHTVIHAEDHKPEHVIGATANECMFDDPYLKNALTIWVNDSIEKIESGEQQEISCGYRYDADMTPGSSNGIAYDGVMRNIVGNHVALVTSGRCGSDVVIGDERIINFNGV